MFTVLDIETTGTNKITDRILEVAYARIEPDTSIIGTGVMYFYDPEDKELENLIDTCEGCRVNGITSDFMKQYKKDFYLNIAHLCSVMHNEYIIGKNIINFDIPFIKNYLDHQFLGTVVSSPVPLGYVDLQDFYAPIFKERWLQKYDTPTRRLGTLEEYITMMNITESEIAEQYNVMFGKTAGRPMCAHSALYDVVMTYMLLRKAVKELGLELVKK